MPNPVLSPSILQTLLAGLSRTIGRGAADDPASAETAAALLQAFRPETLVQAMLAAQAIALHHATIDCFGRAMQTAEEDGPAITRLQRNGASLTRAFTATLHTLHRCQVAAAQAAENQQDLAQQPVPGLRPGGERTAPPCPPPASEPPGPRQDGWEQHPLQRENAAPHPGTEGEALGPRFREDDRGRHPSIVFAQKPMQRELVTGQAKPANEPSPHRPWEDLTEAEQFAILYPERVAAGASSHEDVDLWLAKPGKQAAPPRPAR